MKAIKIILVLVSILVVVFFSTGLLIKETSYEVKVKIDKPLEEVFTAFKDQTKLVDWLPEVKKIEPIIVRLGVVGSEYKMTVENNEQTVVMTEKIIAYIPNKKFTIYFDANEMQKTDDCNFSEENGTTLLTKKVICKSDSYIMSCIFPYFKGTFKEQDQKYLENFKTYIEKQ